MNTTCKSDKKQAKNSVAPVTVLSQEEMGKKVAALEDGLKASTWKELETKGKFTKNDKIAFISDSTLILGCDVGSETHYARAIDARGRELSHGAFEFRNDSEGFRRMRQWALELAASSGKNQIVMGIEPTGHYWFCLYAWMVEHGVSVVQVNPYAVKQTKEVEDNSQRKDDRKDPKLIANLVKDGNYGMPYLPEGLYADLRGLEQLRDQMVEERIRYVNRLHREMRIYFPEYLEAFGRLDSAFSLAVLRKAPFPEDIRKLGVDGLRSIWQEAGLRGRGYSRAEALWKAAQSSMGIEHGTDAGKRKVRWYASQVEELDGQMAEVEEELQRKAMEIPHAGNILKIRGIGQTILGGILSELGDISRFDDVKEVQKISGLGLVACSSGKHKGETRISHRGRKRLRYWLFQAARSAVAHAEEFKELHGYYTTRAGNPLKKMQSLIVVACKILRIIYKVLKTGTEYDPARMLRDIRRPAESPAQAA